LQNDACSCNSESGLTRLTVAGTQVGLSGLEELFAQWRSSGRGAAELSDREILAGLRRRNYVSRGGETQYAAAVLALYARQCSK
jgi:hypothetical protein